MAQPQKYKNPLDNGRYSDQLAIQKITEIKNNLIKDGKLIETSMDLMAGSDQDAYKILKMMLSLNYQIINIVELLGHRDVMCRELTGAIYSNLNDIDGYAEQRKKLLEPIINEYHNKSTIDKWLNSWAMKITTIAGTITAIGVIIAWLSGVIK